MAWRKGKPCIVAAAAMVGWGGLGLGAPTVAAAAPGPTLPAPRVQDLTPRVENLAPRVANLTPRVKSIAPRQSVPNNYTVNSDVLFAFDSAVLSPEAQTVLASVVRQLKAARAGTVTIAGYTDSVGTAPYNQALSQRRADAVQAYLQHAVGNGALGYKATGMGESHPVAPNTLPDGHDNPAGRAENRRVTIVYRQS